MPLDWDKLRIFHAAAKAGSFTHAGDALEMSQSAVSRQVSALEQQLGVPLFHRHARGLILTEQGELLFRTANDVLVKLDSVKAHLADSTEKPRGTLKITTTVGLGSTWLTARLDEFIELYPDIQLEIILDDNELDLSKREADVAIRLRQPIQPDLIQRRLFTVHFHLYASPNYLSRYGQPLSENDLDKHRILTFGDRAPTYLRDMNWLENIRRDGKMPRRPVLRINNVYGLRQAVKHSIGIGLLPDYLTENDTNLVRLLGDIDLPSLDTYFVYAEEMKNTARVSVFRDFLLGKARRWAF